MICLLRSFLFFLHLSIYIYIFFFKHQSKSQSLLFVILLLTVHLLLLIIFIQRYSLLSSRRSAVMSHVILNKQLSFHSTFLNFHRSGLLTSPFFPGRHMAGAM